MHYNFDDIYTTTAAGVKVRHTYVQQKGDPRGLVIILPGRGYTNENPLLFYLRKMAAESEYDVVGVNYGFQMGAEPPPKGTDYDGLTQEVILVLEQILQHRQYDRIIFAGKSLGTPLAVRFAQSFEGVDLRFLLLTPVMNATDYVAEHPTLAIIGTDDQAYDPQKVRQDQNKPWLHWQVFDDLNHALEFSIGWDMSIAVLGTVIEVCEKFINR